MNTKEQFYEQVKEMRSILINPENLKCNCPKTKCEWFGDCQKCIAQHRYYKKHIPNCMQMIFNDKIKEMTQIFEMDAIEKEKRPGEYWDYVKERDKK
jgi:hypothetical protein